MRRRPMAAAADDIQTAIFKIRTIEKHTHTHTGGRNTSLIPRQHFVFGTVNHILQL